MYILNWNNKRYTLPIPTKKIINERLQITNNTVLQNKQQYDYNILVEELYEYIVNLVNVEQLKEMIPHSDIEDIDIRMLEILFLEIAKTYDKPIQDYQNNQTKSKMNEVFSHLPTDKINSLSAMSQAVNSLKND